MSAVNWQILISMQRVSRFTFSIGNGQLLIGVAFEESLNLFLHLFTKKGGVCKYALHFTVLKIFVYLLAI